MSNELTTIDYSGTEAHLRDCLLERNLYVPLGDNNRIIRKHAVKLLQEWETKHARYNGEKVRVIFHRSLNPSAGSHVFASINGENFQCPFEQEVEVKRFFLTECIDRAKTTVTRKILNEAGKPTVVKDFIPTYPYTFIGVVEEKKEEDVKATKKDSVIE